MKIFNEVHDPIIRKDYHALEILAAEASSQVEEPDENGWTAYSWAILYGDEQALAILEQYKLDKGKWQDALLIRGSCVNDVEAIKVALQNGANIEYKHLQNTSALIYAAGGGCPDAVRVLIEYGANVPPDILFHVLIENLEDSKISSRAHMKDYAKVVRILIDAGVDPDLMIDGETAADAIAGDGLHAIEAELKRPKMGNKIPEGVSPLRFMLDEAYGIEHQSCRTLDEARLVEGVVAVMEGDYGGQIYLTCPVRLIRCDAETLTRLLAEIDNLGWNDPEGAGLYFEAASPEAGIVGGMGGGAVRESVWMHPDLMNFYSRVEAVIAGTVTSIHVEDVEPVVDKNIFQRFLSYVKCGLKSHSPWREPQKRKSRKGYRK